MEPERDPEPAGRALTAEQLEAIDRRSEPLLLSAAAGTGKTSVLVERFVRAVRDDAIAPAAILAITFTERAAGELRARVRAELLELGDREAARDTEAAFVGTFHGFCARLLRSHPLAAGLDPDFSIVDEGIAGRLRELAFTEAVRELLAAEHEGAVDLLAAYGVDRTRGMIQQVYSELRSRGQRLPRLPAVVLDEDPEALDAEAAAACGLLDELLGRYGIAYERLKQRRSAVDFDDLELLAGQLLEEHDDLRASWSDRFELLMVDEFQDTNPRQLAILKALDRENLFTVGDELQSIYGFRDADVSLFRERRAELLESGASLALTRNFRSVEPLLEVVNAVFDGRFDEYVPLAAARTDRSSPAVRGSAAAEANGMAAEPVVELLVTDAQGWSEDEDLAAVVADGLPDTQLWRQAEARMLARRVAELVDAGQARAGDVAVLLRASGDLEVFERALQLEGLRTLATVGAFWGHQQIGDLIAYLRALCNPLDEQALYGALASPLAGCSYDCLALLAAAAADARRGVWETAQLALAGEGTLLSRLSAADRDALLGFCARLQAERLTASRRTISQLIERAIEDAGYREHVLTLDWGERRLANLHKLLRLARGYETREGRDLRGFLDHVEYLQVAAKIEPDAPVQGVEPDAVRLMTIHAAKGLEFPVVCVADLGRAAYTHAPTLLVDGPRVGLRLARLGVGGTSPTLAYEELCAERRLREAEEEDRILYVAMTRARDRLLLSGSIDFQRWAGASRATAISWLGPALDEELPLRVQAPGTTLLDLQIGPGGSVHVRCRLNTPSSAPDAPSSAANAPSSAAPAGATATHAGPRPTSDGGAPTPADASAEVHPGVAHGHEASTPSGPAPADGVREESLESDGLTSLSYTSLSELERCGYRFYLERVLGLREDRAATREPSREAGLEARARGALVHRLMELLDFSAPYTPSREEVARAASELGFDIGAREGEEVAALIAGAGAASLARRVAAAQTVRREYPFAFSLTPQEPLITGVIDLLAGEADGGGYLVLDYKSDRVGSQARLGELVERDYGIQRLIYALAVLREGAASVEIVHWFLERPEEFVGVRYTRADRASLEQQLAARVARARTRPFEVSPRPHRGLCLTCPGRTGLCSWDEAHTLRESPDEAAVTVDPG
jgi:ATP-dependent helicase/nuclease subunit A